MFGELDELKPLLSHVSKQKYKVQIRHIVVVICTMVTLLTMSLRNVLSVSITVMVRHEVQHRQHVSNSSIDYDLLNPTEEEIMPGEFDWNAKTQQHILSAFYYGFCIMPLLGGWLSDNVGGKRVVTVSMLLVFISNALIPLTARTNVWLLMAIRVLDGLSQAMIFPGLYVIIGKWTLPDEMSLATSSLNAGICLGFIVSSYVTALLCSTTVFGGWPLAFFISSFVGFGFCLFWSWFPIGDPDDHPWISDNEKKLIQSSLKDHGNKSSLSWSGMFTSPPFWALLISHSTYGFGLFFSQSNVPMFLATILKFNVKTTGLLVSIAYLVQMIVFIASGIVADCLISRSTMSVLNTRKLMTFLTLVLSSVLLILVGYVESTPVFGALCIIGVLGAYGFAGPGLEANFMDITPKHTGIVVGIILSASNATGFAGPAILGTILGKENSITQWRILFSILAALHLFGLIVFLGFADGSQQEWDMGKRATRHHNQQPHPHPELSVTMYLEKCENNPGHYDLPTGESLERTTSCLA